MAFRYTEPLRCDFDSDEEYQEAIDLYESALDDYCDRYMDDRY